MFVLIFDDDVAEQPHHYHFPPVLTVRLFDRADDCLRLVETLKPDVVFMDYHMRSSYKGEHAVRDLRRVHTASALSIVGISSSDQLNARLLAAGANRVVAKRHLQDLLLEYASEADASEADVSESDVSEADASEADASGADASEADASEAGGSPPESDPTR